MTAWLRDLPIRRKLYLIVGLLIGNLALVISLGKLALDTVSSIRAAVASEDVWAKSVRAASSSLARYVLSSDEATYQEYLRACRVPSAYEKVNAEFLKDHPDRAALDAALRTAGVHPDDIHGVVRLFLGFRRAPHVEEAFRSWTEAQGLVAELQALGRRYRTQVETGDPRRDAAQYLARIDDLGRRITALEIEFSSALGAASRWATGFFTVVMIGGSLLIGLLSVAIALYISRGIVAAIGQISRAAARAAEGDLTIAVDIKSRDELGRLAAAFNHMVHRLGEIDRLKSDFFANVSHELRTPLTLILGPLEASLAREDSLPPWEVANLRVAHRNAMRLLKLVNNLLDFSALQAGRLGATFRPTDLAALTTHLASSFRSAFDKAGIELAVECPPLPSPVYVDGAMWEKIVLNLVSNALKYTRQGRVRIRQAIRDGDRVELEVSDTGCGIPESELGNIFRRFYRVAGAEHRTREGSGIGLALVDELVKMHGGSIRVASTVGAGSTFTVSIPLGASHLSPQCVVRDAPATPAIAGAGAYVEEAFGWLLSDADTAAGTAEARPVAAPGPTCDRPRVLLADDNADMRRYIADLLGARYEVEVAPDGESAWAAIRRHPPDLVLSDIMMPALDGLGLLARLRADPRCQSIPFVLLSARAGDDAKVDGLGAGADDYLVKPFSARELLARVHANLEKATLRLESARKEERLRAAEAINALLRDENRRKDAFLAMLAHELRNPLAVVSGVVQVATKAEGRLPDAMNILDRQVRRLVDLVDAALDSGREGLGRMA